MCDCQVQSFGVVRDHYNMPGDVLVKIIEKDLWVCKLCDYMSSIIHSIGVNLYKIIIFHS